MYHNHLRYQSGVEMCPKYTIPSPNTSTANSRWAERLWLSHALHLFILQSESNSFITFRD